jgi:Lrp/AsnC family transcriptional regulator, regulator of ectoine-degradation genes
MFGTRRRAGNDEVCEGPCVMKLDSHDLRILETLQKDGRITKVKLAESAHLSPSPCWERLRRLEDAGVVAGYHARVDVKRVAPMTEVLVEVTLVRHQGEDFRRFEDSIQDVPEIVECWATGGGLDYVMRLAVASVDAYQRLMDRLLDGAIGIDRYFGYVVTKPVKSAPGPSLRLLLGDPDGRR